MKEVSVTESFMGLDKDTRKCQNIETYDECKTRLNIEHLRKECGCLPLSLRLSEEVILIYKSSLFSGGRGDSGLKTACCFVKNRGWRLLW